MTIVIESGIPIPEGDGRKRATKYPFDEMAVGESFEIPATVKNPEQIAARARKLCKPKLFTARKLNGGYRLWRTA